MRNDDNCEAGFTSPRGLKHHQQSKHEGYSYDFSLCDAKFQRQLSLDEHKFKHVGGKYYCNQCNALYATQASLKAHKVVQHEW